MTTGLVDTWLDGEEGGVKGCMWHRPIVYVLTREGLKCTCIRITLPQTAQMCESCKALNTMKE